MNPSLLLEVGVAIVVQVTLLIAVTLLLQRIKGSTQAVYQLWTVCFVLMLWLIAAALLLPHPRWWVLSSITTPEVALQMATYQRLLTMSLVVVWGIGASVSLVRRLHLTWQLSQFFRERCEPVDEPVRSTLTATLPTTDALVNSTTWAVSDQIAGPLCFQLHRPVIVLPRYLLDEDAMTQRHVVWHEWEHLRTQHPMQHFLQGLCSTLLWFHPAVWIAARSAGLTREYWCDEVVATRCGRASDYLRTLLTVAERSGSASCTEFASATLTFGHRRSTLRSRSDRLVAITRSPCPRGDSRVAVVCLIAAAITLHLVWLPTNPVASRRSLWSPWPVWTAAALHTVNVQVRDFESFDNRTQMHELMVEAPAGRSVGN